MGVLSVIAAMAIGAAAAGGVEADNAEQREIALWQTAKDNRMDEFAALLDPGFVAVYGAAINDKAAEVAAISDQKLQSFALSNFKSHAIEPNVLLVTYTAEATGRFRDTDISGRYNAASLWRRTGGNWLLAYHSEVKAQ